jgi:hypothetical protein
VGFRTKTSAADKEYFSNLFKLKAILKALTSLLSKSIEAYSLHKIWFFIEPISVSI